MKNEKKINEVLRIYQFNDEIEKIFKDENNIETIIFESNELMLQIINNEYIFIFEYYYRENYIHMIDLNREIIYSYDIDYLHSLNYKNIQIDNEDIKKIIDKIEK